jgi:membrane associated rhomboid family serine protease
MIPLRDDNPTRRRPVVTISIIVLCALVYLWQMTLRGPAGEAVVYSLGLIPAVLSGRAALPGSLQLVPAPLTLITSMFLHGGLLHVGGNMLYLWIFGDNIEDRLGRVPFVAFYLLCGVAAGLAQSVPDLGSEVPMIGASGAVSGVLGAYLLLYPHARVLVVIPLFILFYTFELPAVIVLGIWFVGQLVSSLAQGAGEAGVAFSAHVGGFVAGIVLLQVFIRLRPQGPRLR